jgi:NAD(P)H-hydrate epimerase
MRLVTAEEMRALDSAAARDYGISTLILMENAGLALLTACLDLMGQNLAGKKVVIFAGRGNNGGDGLVLARHLLNRGAEVRLFLLCPPENLQGDPLVNWKILENMEQSAQVLSEERQLNLVRLALYNCDLAVDAILGTGLKGPIGGFVSQLIKTINASSKPVLACDIPSGLCAESGRPLGTAVRATQTVSFAYAKLGLVLPPAADYVGRLSVADISLPRRLEEQIPSQRQLLDADFCRWLNERPRESHKGDFGHLLLAAGSARMPGAAILAAKAALKMGSGLCTLALPQPIAYLPFSQLTEAMLLPLPASPGGCFTHFAAEGIASFSASAYLIGPGLGREDQLKQLILTLLTQIEKPLLLDADALFALEGEKEAVRKAKGEIILTPHPGEAARLLQCTTEQIQKNRLTAAQQLTEEWQATVVLKGAGTIIASPNGRILINSSGNPGMAKGGSGDVLTGMIGALLAQGLPTLVACGLGVWLHGRAGDLAASQHGEQSMLPSDIVDNIGAAIIAAKS